MTIKKGGTGGEERLVKAPPPPDRYSRAFFENRLLLAVGMKRELKRALQPDGNYTVAGLSHAQDATPFEREMIQQPVQQVTVAAKTKTLR